MFVWKNEQRRINMKKIRKSIVSLMVAGAVVTSTFDMSSIVANAESVTLSQDKIYGFDNASAQLKLELYARYNSESMSADGGSMEIVEYNSVNGYAYAVKVDNQVLIDYIVGSLGGNIKADSIYKSPYGEGRIQVITAYKAPTATEDGYVDILQGEESVRKVLKSTSSGNTETKEETFTKELTKESEVVSAEEIKSIIVENATKDVVIKNSDGVTFKFTKGTMEAVDGKSEYDFGTKIIKDFDKATATSSKIDKDKFVLQIDYNYSGKLPANATITFNVGSEYADKTLYYYLYNENNTYKLIQSVVVDGNGNVSVKQDSCSTYVLTSTQIVSDNTNTTSTDNAPKTEDNTPIVWFAVLAMVSGFGIVYVGRKKRKVR